MKVTGCKYAPFALKFKRPFVVSNTAISERKIIFIKIQNDERFFSYGEAAPLPEFGSETFEETENFLKTALADLPGKEFTSSASVRQYLNTINPPAAARFAIEEALLFLLAKNNIQELSYLLQLGTPSLVKINAALGFLKEEEYIPRISAFLEEGYSAIKIKIGRDNFDIDLRILQNIRKRFGERIILRADVNGKWKIKEAISNIRLLDEVGLEYIEQPVNSIEEFLELKNNVRTPLAADESIRSLSDAHKFIESHAVDFIILKPMLTGGIIPSLEIINKAKKNGINIVLSSSFETIAGALPSLLLASSLDKDIAHGFGVFDLFENDPFNSAVLIKNGCLNFNDIDIHNIYSTIEKNIGFYNG